MVALPSQALAGLNNGTYVQNTAQWRQRWGVLASSATQAPLMYIPHHLEGIERRQKRDEVSRA